MAREKVEYDEWGFLISIPKERIFLDDEYDRKKKKRKKQKK